MICDRRPIAALSDGILPLSIKVDKILSDKDTICSIAIPLLELAQNRVEGGIRFRLSAGL